MRRYLGIAADGVVVTGLFVIDFGPPYLVQFENMRAGCDTPNDDFPAHTSDCRPKGCREVA